jgi:hypothetical protein
MGLFRGEKAFLGFCKIQYDGFNAPIRVVDATDTTLFQVDSAGSITQASGATATFGADKLVVGGNIVPQELSLSRQILAADTVGQHVFIAPWGLKITGIQFVNSVASTSGTLKIRKITDASAPGAAAGATVVEQMTGALDLSATSTVNTVFSGTLSATAADITLAAGDKLAFLLAGTLTGLVGTVTIRYKRV